MQFLTRVSERLDNVSIYGHTVSVQYGYSRRNKSLQNQNLYLHFYLVLIVLCECNQIAFGGQNNRQNLIF